MVEFDPQPWEPPKAPKLEGPFAKNTVLASAELWQTGGVGPEDVAVGDDGTAYSGLEDGTIVRFHRNSGVPQPIANTTGRPLGIEVAGDGSLIVCDAYKGLLRVTPTGTVSTIVDSFGGERFLFTNNATIANDGTVYFTVTSRRHTFDQYVDDLLEHSGTGRLFTVTTDGMIRLIYSDLQFANGVALNADETMLYVAETGSYSVRRFRLTGDRSVSVEPFLSNLPGFPDNLTFAEGTLWVAMASPRQPMVDAMMTRPRLRRMTRRLPEFLKPKPSQHGIVLGFDENGTLTHNLQDAGGRVAVTTGARFHDGRLYIGSLTQSTVAIHTL